MGFPCFVFCRSHFFVVFSRYVYSNNFSLKYGWMLLIFSYICTSRRITRINLYRLKGNRSKWLMKIKSWNFANLTWKSPIRKKAYPVKLRFFCNYFSIWTYSLTWDWFVEAICGLWICKSYLIISYLNLI